MKITPHLILISLIAAQQAQAAHTADDLAKRCDSPDNRSYCEGYIAGFYDGRLTSDYGVPRIMSCPPSGARGEVLPEAYSQMVPVFRKWAQDNPEKLHYADWMALREAFAREWPCDRRHSLK